MYASQVAEGYKNIVSYYNGGEDLCVLAYNKKLVTLGEIRQAGFYTCMVFYKNFTDYINDGTLFSSNMILTRDYVYEAYNYYMNSMQVMSFRKQLMVIDIDDIFRVWKQVGLIDVCGAGFQFNEVQYDIPEYDYISVINRIASANEHNFIQF